LTREFSQNPQNLGIFKVIFHLKEEEIRRQMIQPSRISYVYFPRYGYSNFLFKSGSSNQDQNFLNFWVSEIWCHSIGMNIDRAMMSCVSFNHTWFSRLFNLFCLITLILSQLFSHQKVSSNFHFSKLYDLWESCLTHISQETIFQCWSEKFPWISHGTKKRESSQLFDLSKFNAIQHRWTWID